MQVTIQPSQIKGTIQASTSKSSMQRACAAALLSNGTTIIKHPGHSNDDLAAIDVIQKLGAKIQIQQNGDLSIESSGVNISPPPEGPREAAVLNCGESGLGIRMFTPLAALSDQQILITGTGSLTVRPMNFFDEIFPQLNIQIESNNGKLPMKIKGPLQPKNIEIDGSLSSQFLTGLILAYAAAAANEVSIKVKDLKSKPYIDLTLQVMQQFGMNTPENKNYEEFYFLTRSGDNSPTRHYTVEGDWSGAAFLLVAGALAGNIVVKGLDVSSTQADKAILQALMNCGAELSIQSEQIEIGPAVLKAFHFNATDCPDLFPPLVALACYCNGKTVIEGVTRLKHKESNRALSLQQEFGKMGVEIQLQDDLMIVHGGNVVKGATVHSHHDHRIAMACAAAALKANGETIIDGAEAINKSYPDFYKDIQSLGGNVNTPQSTVNTQ